MSRSVLRGCTPEGPALKCHLYVLFSVATEYELVKYFPRQGMTRHGKDVELFTFYGLVRGESKLLSSRSLF